MAKNKDRSLTPADRASQNQDEKNKIHAREKAKSGKYFVIKDSTTQIPPGLVTKPKSEIKLQTAAVQIVDHPENGPLSRGEESKRSRAPHHEQKPARRPVAIGVAMFPSGTADPARPKSGQTGRTSTSEKFEKEGFFILENGTSPLGRIAISEEGMARLKAHCPLARRLLSSTPG